MPVEAHPLLRWSGMAQNQNDAAIEWARTILRKSKLTAEVAWGSDSATTYRLQEDGAALAYLKIGVGALRGERDRLVWLRDKVAVPDVLAFATESKEAWLLTAPLYGTDLCRPDHTAHPDRLVRLLACALMQLHSLDPAGCPFVGPDEGGVVIHGDACLPNFVVDGGQFVGYLDVGDLRLGRPEVDLAAAVWSLDYNLGAGFGGDFLREYGWPEDDEATVEQLRRSYETV